MNTPLDEVVLATLGEHPAIGVRSLVSLLRDLGLDVTKSDVNAVLYRALDEGAVVREGESPPLWSLAGEASMEHATDPEWIIDRWLERTGEEWSVAQRRAAAKGTRVLGLAAFTADELQQALIEVDVVPLTWDAWSSAVVAVRSRSIRV
jgi:hypothetical protein